MRTKNRFFEWQICQVNHYGWLILLKFYWFLNSNSQEFIVLIRPILDPKSPIMFRPHSSWWPHIIHLGIFLNLFIKWTCHVPNQNIGSICVIRSYVYKGLLYIMKAYKCDIGLGIRLMNLVSINNDYPHFLRISLSIWISPRT